MPHGIVGRTGGQMETARFPPSSWLVGFLGNAVVLPQALSLRLLPPPYNQFSATQIGIIRGANNMGV